MLCVLIRIATSIILMSTLNIPYCIEDQNDFAKLSPFASWPGATVNSQWLELPMSWINFHGLKDLRAIEELL